MNPFKIFKKLDPVKPIQKGVDYAMDKIYVELGMMIVRHGLTALGVSSVLSGDETTKVVGAAMTAGGLLWSAFRKIQRARALK